jgi:dCMP deaminase
MFIAIIGTRFSGKSSIENYLVAAKGFKSVRLIQSNPENDFSVFEEKFEVGNYLASQASLWVSLNDQVVHSQSPISSGSTSSRDSSSPGTDPTLTKHLSFLSMSPFPSPTPMSFIIQQQTLCFPTPDELLKYVTEKWQDNYVTVDLYTRQLIEPFIRRPFFSLLCCDAPLMQRFKRSKRYGLLVQFDIVIYAQAVL